MPVQIYLCDPDLYEEFGVYHELPIHSEKNLDGYGLMELCQEIKPRQDPMNGWVLERQRLGFDGAVCGAAMESNIDKEHVIGILTVWGFARVKNGYFLHKQTRVSVRVQAHRIDCGERSFHDMDDALAFIARQVFGDE